MLQPWAAHSYYKVGKFIQCVNNHIYSYYKQFLYFALGTFNAIYTLIVRTETNYFHKILSFYKNSKSFIKFYMRSSFCKCRRAT